MSSSSGWSRTAYLISFLLAIITHSAAAQPLASAKRPLSIDDILNLEQLDRATMSPDGEWVAAVIRRPARVGEIYGRAAYEVDPTRSDIWLIATKTGARHALTRGAAKAAGFWCATWSPDGQRLAMLSTAPEGREPRGGDNVRLYVWNRSSGAVVRMSDDGVMTQTRYGSALDKLDMRGGADRGTVAHACSTGSVAENAPFLWLDEHRLLVAMLPKGEVAAAIDQYERPFRNAARDAVRVRNGSVPTVSVVASGASRSLRDGGAAQAILRIVDVRTHRQTMIASVPSYPFRGSLTASVSPDRKRVAVLATIGALQPNRGHRFPNGWDDTWTVERRLGFVDLVSGTTLRWAALPANARYPLELYGWSPNGRRVALRARADPFADATPLFVADADTGTVTPVGAVSIGQASASVEDHHSSAAAWVDDYRLAARSTDGKWWLASDNAAAKEIVIPADASPPDRLTRAGDGSLVAFAGKALLRFDPATVALIHAAEIGGEASFQLPEDSDIPASTRLILLHRNDGAYELATIDTVSGGIGPSIPAVTADLLDTDFVHGTILFSQSGPEGIYLRQARLAGGPSLDLVKLDTSLGQLDWGETRLITYKSADGADLNGSVILPPGYQPGRRYPTLVWVYGGYRVPTDLRGDYMTLPSMPGIYNLHLYAAKGYVVLVPSMPLGGRGERHDIYAQIPHGVMPAIDKLVALGIADPARLGVFGQSFGGYSVYALVSQTDRFKAAVAIAGLSELAGNYGQFDPTARGYPGIEHEKNDNWAQTDLFGLPAPPWQDPAGYARNSPLSYVDRVNTPLLLVHGDMDIRGAPTQAELFFYSLYAQGKVAEFLRYGGESHSLAQSPANVRDVFDRTIGWFDRFLRQ